jgi:hypothetical protein
VNAVLNSSLPIEFEGVTGLSDSKTAQVLTERRVEDVESVGPADEDNARLDCHRRVPLYQSTLVDEGVGHRQR